MRLNLIMWTILIILIIALSIQALAESRKDEFDVSLIKAAFTADLPEVIKFIEKGANVNAKHNNDLTPLHAAVIGVSGNIDDRTKIVKLLIDKGANAHVIDKKANAPLSYAVENGHEKIINLFLAKGCEKDELGMALVIAAQGGKSKIAKLLIDNGADVNFKTPEGATSLMKAQQNNHTDVLELLKKAGATK